MAKLSLARELAEPVKAAVLGFAAAAPVEPAAPADATEELAGPEPMLEEPEPEPDEDPEPEPELEEDPELEPELEEEEPELP